MIDLVLLQTEKGGDPQQVRNSESKRGSKPELVDDVLERYKLWTQAQFAVGQQSREINAVQKQIGALKKSKAPDSEVAPLLAQKVELESKVPGLKAVENTKEQELRKLAGTIGNLVHESVPVSQTEDDNAEVKVWHPDGPNAKPEHRTDFLSHHELMYRMEMLDQERGAKVAGHRGYFLMNEGIDLNQALISYGLDFLRSKSYKKIQAPFIMKRSLMSKTAQLEDFDESLYKLESNAPEAGMEAEDDKYLIATSEQPLSALHSDEWFDDPNNQLPIRYAGYSTCFRKEAGSHGRETWGIFRVHQFEKIEQFCITDPASSWTEFDSMIEHSEEFYQSLKLPYHIVSIVSGALNNAAAKKYDLEAWFPFQGEYKELVSVSNCTDYQSRSLEVRCGVKKQNDPIKRYVHMLNGTLCATERAMCCIVENYQTKEGVIVPEVLRKYMGGKDFIPFVRELPKEKVRKGTSGVAKTPVA